MRDSKKAIIVTIAALLLIIVASVIIIEPYCETEYYSYNDKSYRDKNQGAFDYIILGSSHAMTAFYMPILDSELDCNSINLSGGLMTFRGRKAILEEEIDRNNISTVVLEIAYNALPRDKYEVEGSSYLIPRLGSGTKRMRYLLKNESLDNLDRIYSFELNNGIHVWSHIAYLFYKNIGQDNLIQRIKEGCSNFDFSQKTYQIRSEGNNLRLSEDDVKQKFNSLEIPCNYLKDNLKQIDSIVKLCHQNGTEVIFVVTPIADSVIWEYSNWDYFYDTMLTLGEEYNAKVYDFNLLKNRYELFDDAKTYSDDHHMWDAGAQVFTEVYCDIMQKVKTGEDVSNLFYSTYEEMKADSPYMQYLSE